MTLTRRATAEAVGTGFLVATVIGSGIAASRLSPADIGLQLLENSLATGLVLAALIVALQPVSAAFNPVITLLERVLGTIGTRETVVLIAAQLTGAAVGAIVANLMFGLPAVTVSGEVRGGPGIWLAEIIATLGLVLIIFAALRGGRHHHVGYLVGGYIAGAYWFTSSTSVANPAVTLARTLSDTFAGIAPASAMPFLIMQLVGGAVGLLLITVLYPQSATKITTPVEEGSR